MLTYVWHRLFVWFSGTRRPRNCLRSVERCQLLNCRRGEECYVREEVDYQAGTVFSVLTCANANPCYRYPCNTGLCVAQFIDDLEPQVQCLAQLPHQIEPQIPQPVTYPVVKPVYPPVVLPVVKPVVKPVVQPQFPYEKCTSPWGCYSASEWYGSIVWTRMSYMLMKQSWANCLC